MQVQFWLVCCSPQHLNLQPTHRADPAAQGFGCGFLGSKTSCQLSRVTATVLLFRRSKNSCQKAITVPVDRLLYALYFDNINPARQLHLHFRFMAQPSLSPGDPDRGNVGQLEE